jgi:ubiquinone/menaquinone biosynthesis C-methylase UbiE
VRFWHPARIASVDEDSPENVRAFIEARALEYPSRLEDDFVKRALNLGVESGMVLDVGARVGLISLKILWQSENFYTIGIDNSAAMIEQARETATAWELGERAFFQVGDARRMRFKNAYFDLVVSDLSLHRFDDAVAVLKEISRVLKPTGAVLIRDFRRPSRFSMAGHIQQQAARWTAAMRPQLEAAIRAAYTRPELLQAVRESGLSRMQMVETDPDYIMMERRGQTDPRSWIIAREQYR